MTLVTPPSKAGATGAIGTEERGPEPGDGRWPRRPARPRLVVAVALVLLGLLVVGLALSRSTETPALTQRDVDESVARGLEAQAEEAARAPADATVAWAAIQPSLVLITTQGGDGAGSGAGVVVNAEGLVLTALHVVEGADRIAVAFADGTRSEGQVASRDPENDIATIVAATLPQPIVPAVLGGGVTVGAPVFAVGHPLGLANSLSAGVVSALDRSIPVDGQRLENLIQFDAAVNPGNSGGPLLNKAGQVVGIVTGLANPNDDGYFIGVGFAVPIATAGGTAGGPPL